MDTSRKLKFSEKLSYGLSDFPEAANSILAAFLSMFYTDNIGLAAGAIGTMFFISKLFDGISMTFPLIFKFGGDTRAWQIVFIIYGLVVIAGLLYGFFFSREYVRSVESVIDEGNGNKGKISFVEGLKLFFTNRYLILALIMTVLVNLVTQINSSSQTYFYTYTMGDANLTTKLNLVSIVPILVGIVVLVGPALAKFGKKKCMYIGILGQLVGFILRGIAGTIGSVPVLITGTVLAGICTGLLAVPVSTLFADGIDYGEYKTNKRIEGMGSAITSFSQKISSGIGMAAVGWILALTGYVANEAQTAAVNAGITALFAWIPAVLLGIIFFIVCFGYHYDEIAQDVISELNRRKEEKRLD